MNIEVKEVMDREKVANTIHTILDAGIGLLEKDDYKPADHTKIKIIRTLGSHVNGAVNMIQQETAQMRAKIVVERMKQLGYNTPS